MCGELERSPLYHWVSESPQNKKKVITQYLKIPWWANACLISNLIEVIIKLTFCSPHSLDHSSQRQDSHGHEKS